jgi:hypothetical protein
MEQMAGKPTQHRGLNLRVEPASIEDLPELVALTMDLFAHSGDLRADSQVQEHGLRLILEQKKILNSQSHVKK